MPLLEENTNPKNNQSTDRSPTPPVTETKPNNLITTIGQLLPFAPLVFEQFTGQKVPPMTGTMADISLSLQQIQLSLQTLANQQQNLNQRLTNLENGAVQQLTNLTNQFNSLRLTHTKEQKRIEYGNPQNHPSSHLEEENQEY